MENLSSKLSRFLFLRKLESSIFSWYWRCLTKSALWGGQVHIPFYPAETQVMVLTPWFSWSMDTLMVKQGKARTQSPTKRNYASEFPTFGEIAEVNPTWVQWKGLALGEPPSWSWLTPMPGKYACFLSHKTTCQNVTKIRHWFGIH